jgi:hypothetical protein
MCVRGSQDSERSCKCVLEEARITHLAWNSHFLKETENNVLAWIIKNKASYD